MEKSYLSINKINLNLNERKVLKLISGKRTISLKDIQRFLGGAAVSANVLLNLEEHEFVSKEKNSEKYKVNITKEEYEKYFYEDDDFLETEFDELFHEAAKCAFENGKISNSMIMSRFSVGMVRANRILDQLEDAGVIENNYGNAARKVIMTKQEYEKIFGKKIDE